MGALQACVPISLGKSFIDYGTSNVLVYTDYYSYFGVGEAHYKIYLRECAKADARPHDRAIPAEVKKLRDPPPKKNTLKTYV